MKQTVAVIFGGTNTEHEVSIVSARSIMKHLDPIKFTVVPIYIPKTKSWDMSELTKHPPNVVFPVLHGPFGEDGTIQGMLKMLHLPFVGCDVLASALCMDKVVQKQLCLQQGLPVVPFVFASKYDWQQHQGKILQYAANKLTYPVFVKPANQGSSIGVVKIVHPDQLSAAIETAFTYDTKILVEQAVVNTREIECAVLGNHQPQASVLGEIKPSNEFYDYDAKYIDGQSEAVIPAPLPAQVADNVKKIAIKAFQILNCSGLARIDFLIDSQTHNIYLNELNTMPGFTDISMYSKLWEASGLPYERLLEKLIDLALEKHAEDSQRQLNYTPKLPWHEV